MADRRCMDNANPATAHNDNMTEAIRALGRTSGRTPYKERRSERKKAELELRLSRSG